MRAIDADKVEKWSWQEPIYSDSINDRTDLRDFLRSLPTLSPDDVRPVGKWEQKEVFSLAETTIEQMQSARCSVCGKYHTTPFSYYFTDYAYCPNCGARLMNGGTNDS